MCSDLTQCGRRPPPAAPPRCARAWAGAARGGARGGAGGRGGAGFPALAGTVEASDRGGEERFCARGGGHQSAGHEPRCAAPRPGRGLGGPHNAGFGVHSHQRLEPGDLAGRVLAADRLVGVDQIRRATLDAGDAWIARGAEICADASLAEVRVMLPNRCADHQANRQCRGSSSASKAVIHMVAISSILPSCPYSPSLQARVAPTPRADARLGRVALCVGDRGLVTLAALPRGVWLAT